MNIDQQSIMIFGAGINQLELIREANKMGITTVVVDPENNPPGKNEADHFYQVAGNDYEKTKSIALKHNINGLVTGQMEKPLRLMAKLASELGYIFHSPEVVEKSLNKWLMKQAFIEHQIPCAKGKLFKNDDAITKESLKDFSFPVIIKPQDAFSSKGVFKTDRHEDVSRHVNQTRSFSSEGKVIVEEFLDGKEYSVESITYRGKTTVIQITEKFLSKQPYTVEMGHLQPADISENKKEKIKRVVEKAISAIGIDNSASHAEVMMTSDGPKLIEIGARLGGDFIASHLTKASTGISMDKAAIQVALGIEPELIIKKSCFAFIQYIELPVNVTVSSIDPIVNTHKDPGLVFAHTYIKPGDLVQKITHSAQRPACVIVKGKSRDDVFELANKYKTIINNKIKLVL